MAYKQEFIWVGDGFLPGSAQIGRKYKGGTVVSGTELFITVEFPWYRFDILFKKLFQKSLI
jgi:hypothetical protein